MSSSPAAQFPDQPSPAGGSPLESSVTVDGVEVRYGIRGSGDRDLLLVHGSGAHHVWWHRVVPLLEDHWRIISVDLSGHGDSGHREDYDVEVWAEELLAVLRDAGAQEPVIAAHSLGGRVALVAAARHPEQIAGLLLFDVGIWAPDHLLANPPPARRAPSPPRAFPTRAEGLARFRLMPPQPEPADGVLDPVGEYSLGPVEGGWAWKQDRGGFPTLYEERVEQALASVTLPVAYISGGDSSVVDDARAERAAQVLQNATTVRLPGAHHHLTLEVPEACAQLIDEFAAERLGRTR